MFNPRVGSPVPASLSRRQTWRTLSLCLGLGLSLGCGAGVAAQTPEAPAPAPDAPPPPNTKPALLRFDPPLVSFGDVYFGEKLNSKVTITNVSGHEVPIARVQPSCGCTLARLHLSNGTEIVAKAAPAGALPAEALVVLPAGDAITMEIEVVPPAAMKGHIEKSVIVAFMDKDQPQEELPIKADVSLAYQIVPDFLNIGLVHKSGVIDRTFQVVSNIEGDWEITGFSPGNEGEALPPGMKFEVLDTEGKNRRVRMLWDGPRALGSATVKVRVDLKGERVPYAEFATWGVVGSDLTFDNNDTRGGGLINFDLIPKGGRATRTVSITNADPSVPYKLESVQIVSNKPQYFSTNIRTLEEGRSYAVDITCDSGITDPSFQGRVVFNAPYPDDPSHSINFVGSVAPN